MSRRAARQDGNHQAVVQALLEHDCSVANTHQIGGGFPDIAVGFQTRSGECRTILIEIKDGSLPASRRRLTPDEAKWHSAWKGGVYTVHSPRQAVEIVFDLQLRGCNAEQD